MDKKSLIVGAIIGFSIAFICYAFALMMIVVR